ncbi:hypothetical protein OOU_Y34scaffold01160g2 [Pyricularia oryzae Y34]|uniref:Uncharacterized protein n=1 Tax=Pyricularia oryzae (strain Y34) TaxID=1143189 RepID=A0AA97NLN6_PYRO3|nr:hypothetical protein OOU_Y34scaffold01160g2 [Pyricularia oryzae Y34]
MAVDGDGGSEILERNSSSISQPPRAITIEPGKITRPGCDLIQIPGIKIVHSSSMLLVVIRIHLCMPFSPATSMVRFMSQRVSITNAFADPRSPTETSLAPAWAATRCAHGTPVVPNQCLKSSSSLGGKVCVLMSCASSATLLSPNGRSGPLLGRFASFSTAPLLQSCRLALAELEQLDES